MATVMLRIRKFVLTLMDKFRVVSNGTTFIQTFMNIRQVVQQLWWENR
jgi:hypothetical protein